MNTYSVMSFTSDHKYPWMMNKVLRGLPLLSVLALFCESAVAKEPQSVDCEHLEYRYEKLICEVREIRILDMNVEAAYQDHKAKRILAATKWTEGERVAVIEELEKFRRDWLAERDKCQDVDCMKSMYERRFKEIVGIVRRVSAATPPESEPDIELPSWDSYTIRYELVKGKRYAICRDYEQNLNRFSHELPMVCERKLHPDFSKFKKPKWEPVELIGREEMLLDIDFAGYRRKLRDKPLSQEARENILKRVRQGKLWRSRINMLRDGKPDTVYRYAREECEDSKQLANDNLWPQTYQHFVEDTKRPGRLRLNDFSYTGATPGMLFYYDGVLYKDIYSDYGVGGFDAYTKKQAKIAIINPGMGLSVAGRLTVYEYTGYYPGWPAVATQVCEFDIWYDNEIFDKEPFHN